ncbi:MAG: Zn-ribbon domain-containing OB-fold protein, partial [Methanobacteriota archaeon]
RKQVTPMAVCSACRGRKVEKIELPTEGSIVSYTIQVVASEDFINDVPFAFVLVKLTDGTVVPGWVPYVAKPDDLPMGAKVRFSPSYKPGVMFEKI